MDVLADAAIHSKSVLSSTPNLSTKSPNGVAKISPKAAGKAAIQVPAKEKLQQPNLRTNFAEAQVLGSYVRVKLLSKLDGRKTVKVELSDGTICEIIATRVRPLSGKQNNNAATQVTKTLKSTAGETQMQHPQTVAVNNSRNPPKISFSAASRGFTPAARSTGKIPENRNNFLAPFLGATSGMTSPKVHVSGVAKIRRIPTQLQTSALPFRKKGIKLEGSAQFGNGNDSVSSSASSVPPIANLNQSSNQTISAKVHTHGVPPDNKPPVRKKSESSKVPSGGKLDRQRLCTWLSIPRISQLCRAITEHRVGKASLRKASAKHKVPRRTLCRYLSQLRSMPELPPSVTQPSADFMDDGRATIRDLQILLKYQSWDRADNYLRPHFDTATRLPSPTEEGFSADKVDADSQGMRTPDTSLRRYRMGKDVSSAVWGEGAVKSLTQTLAREFGTRLIESRRRLRMQMPPTRKERRMSRWDIAQFLDLSVDHKYVELVLDNPVLTEYVRQLVVLSEWSNAQKQQIAYLEGTITKQTLCRRLTLPGGVLSSLTPPGMSHMSPEPMELEGNSDSDSPQKIRVGSQSPRIIRGPELNRTRNTRTPSPSSVPSAHSQSPSKSQTFAYSDLQSRSYAPRPPSYPPPAPSFPPRPPSFPPPPLSTRATLSPRPRPRTETTSKDSVPAELLCGEQIGTDRSNSPRAMDVAKSPKNSVYATQSMLHTRTKSANPGVRRDATAESSDVGGGNPGQVPFPSSSNYTSKRQRSAIQSDEPNSKRKRFQLNL